MFVCTHILTIWTQVFYLNQTMGQQWRIRSFLSLNKQVANYDTSLGLRLSSALRLWNFKIPSSKRAFFNSLRSAK